MTNPLRIGITIGLNRPDESLWTNGIKQNAVFLAETLRRCPSVGTVLLVNMNSAVPITDALPWDRDRWPTVPFDEALGRLDVLIELGGQVSPAQTGELKAMQTRLVSYCCGFEYVHAMEAVLFGWPSLSPHLFVNQRYDALWMIPQVAPISASYFATLRRRPGVVVPFVWDPMFIEQASSGFEGGGVYRPAHGPKLLTVMEPNIDVVKFCLYPAFIAEHAFRRRPDLVSFLHVTNAQRLADQSKEFVAVMSQLDIVKAGKASFVGRHDTPRFLAEMTDVVIAHQWENALNYFYLEVCWQGFPLVHNAHLCRELGYYYPGHNIEAGASQLLHAMQAHDEQCDSYRNRQRELIARFLPSNPEVVSRYEALLADLMRHHVA